MANTALTLSMGPQEHQVSTEGITNDRTNVTVPNVEGNGSDSMPAESLRCFVCDAVIQGRHYALATCRTQSSRSRVIEKLGELVGERYMVVISEDDVICRSCANLINTLDRLEVEMRNVRENVLRFLEQKYSLEEGELLGSNEKPKPSQPPQITKCNSQSASTCQSKKRGASSLHTSDKNKNKKSNVWVQCDKCQYTTLHNSFMVHHIRDHIKQKVFCDKCGGQLIGNQQRSHDCNSKDHSDNSTASQNIKPETPAQDITQSVMDIPVLEKTIEQDVPVMSLQTYSESQISNNNENVPLIRLSNLESFHIQGILTSDNASVVNQPVYVRVLQPIEVNNGSTHPAMITTSNSDADLVVKAKENSGKQILTLTEDGNLEMVDVSCWNDIQSSEPGPSITFP